MVYKDRLAACVKVGGRIIREVQEDGNNVVRLPFGTDYSLLLKNTDEKRAVISVSIDGQDVLGGEQIVVDGGSSTDLAGFLDGQTVRNMFRFIKKTENIANHRGDFIDDGFIEISWQFEKPRPAYYCPRPPRLRRWPRDTWDRRKRKNPILRDSDINPPDAMFGGKRVCQDMEDRSIGTDMNFAASPGINSMEIDPSNICKDFVDNQCADLEKLTSGLDFDSPRSDEGLTVEGAETQQDWHTTHVGYLDPYVYRMTIHLKGEVQGRRVRRVIGTREKVQCQSCGKANRSSSKYCVECGTYLLD